jgi:predicted ATPase/DNA-binding winged helix-turn-helix (wHTH) protein
MVGPLTAIPPAELRFGRFRLDAATDRLFEGDREVELSPRAFAVLKALVSRAGELLPNAALLSAAWPGESRQGNSLSRCISEIRLALGEDDAGPRFVVEVPRRGYRLTARVTEIDLAQARASSAWAASRLRGPVGGLIGRDAAVAEIVAAIRTRRLVSLVGPGGIGKTTVARAVADRVAERFADGVVFVDLGSVASPDLVAGVVASAIGARVKPDDCVPTILEHLADRDLLLVLDTCEHVLEPVADLAERLIQAVPTLNLLVTSREALQACEEWVRQLPPLELPPAEGALTAEDARAFPSVQLFVERASAASENFQFDAASVAPVIEICRKLDGIPLAIDIVAARVAGIGLRELSDRLTGSFALSARGRRTALARQQTLRATLDWSYALLSTDEQGMLHRLSAFAGGFALEAAHDVAADDGWPFHKSELLLADLVAKCLVTVDTSSEPIVYRLLDTTRAYALERLDAGGGAREARRRHALRCCHDLATAEEDWERLPASEWLQLYTPLIVDIRSALAWCFGPDGDPAIGVELAALSTPVWFQLRADGEYLRHAQAALRAIDAQLVSNDLLAIRLHLGCGHALVQNQGPSRTGNPHFYAALALADRIGVGEFQLRAAWALAGEFILGADYASAAKYAERMERALGSDLEGPGSLIYRRNMAQVLHFLGDQAGARSFAEALKDIPAPRSRFAINTTVQLDHQAVVDVVFARILWLQGYPDQAMARVRRAIARAEVVKLPFTMAYVLAGGACPLAMWTGDIASAKRWTADLARHAKANGHHYYASWAACFELALETWADPPGSAEARLRLATREPRQLDEMAVISPSLLNTVSIDRANAGLAGWCLAENIRVRAERERRLGRESAAEALMLCALRVAERQGVHAWRLRAATSLADLWIHQSREDEANELLTDALSPFTEGFATRDLQRARALLRRARSLGDRDRIGGPMVGAL